MDWTSADSLFFALIEQVHARNMRLIVDFSWNHTGSTFWAWKDILAKQRDSRFADWYDLLRFDDPASPDTNEFAYDGWMGVETLPEVAKVDRTECCGGNLHPAPKTHVYHITRRWLHPNGDGDPSDGIDGFRLDIAEMVPLGFWRDYRKFVRGINPEAYLVGEVWWDEWPDHMTYPEPWLRGDIFNAVMSCRWYMPTRSFFAGAPPHVTATGCAAHLEAVSRDMTPDFNKAMMNLAASHDSPRLATSVYNADFKYKDCGTARGDSGYRIDRPDERARQVQRLILMQQFTWRGAPHIWNGDEVGMWGADDPDMRKPIVWDDLEYEDETAHPFGLERRRDAVAPDTALFALYRELIAFRKANARLFADGSVEWILTDDDASTLAYQRVLDGERALVAFNASDRFRTVSLDVEGGTWVEAFPPGARVEFSDGPMVVAMAPLTACVYIRK